MTGNYNLPLIITLDFYVYRPSSSILFMNTLVQDPTNLIFACTDFRAHKMVLRARSCMQNYVCIKHSLWALGYIV